MHNKTLLFKFPKLTLVRVYPLPCFHIGAPQSDATFIREHLRRIAADPHGVWISMGDGGECVTAGHSKGDPYAQIYNPQQQLDIIVSLLTPIKRKGLLGVRGNHGHRVYKASGVSFDKNICDALDIPYLGAQGFCGLHVGKHTYELYFHHGVDSGITLASKVNKAEHFGRFVDADAIFTAHSHIAIALPPLALNSRQGTKLRHQYICGSGYDSRTGYASDKGYPPLLPSFLSVCFSGTKRHQLSERYASDGKHVVNGDYGIFEQAEV